MQQTPETGDGPEDGCHEDTRDCYVDTVGPAFSAVTPIFGQRSKEHEILLRVYHDLIKFASEHGLEFILTGSFMTVVCARKYPSSGKESDTPCCTPGDIDFQFDGHVLQLLECIFHANVCGKARNVRDLRPDLVSFEWVVDPSHPEHKARIDIVIRVKSDYSNFILDPSTGAHPVVLNPYQMVYMRKYSTSLTSFEPIIKHTSLQGGVGRMAVYLRLIHAGCSAVVITEQTSVSMRRFAGRLERFRSDWNMFHLVMKHILGPTVPSIAAVVILGLACYHDIEPDVDKSESCGRVSKHKIILHINCILCMLRGEPFNPPDGIELSVVYSMIERKLVRLIRLFFGDVVEMTTILGEGELPEQVSKFVWTVLSSQQARKLKRALDDFDLEGFFIRSKSFIQAPALVIMGYSFRILHHVFKIENMQDRFPELMKHITSHLYLMSSLATAAVTVWLSESRYLLGTRTLIGTAQRDVSDLLSVIKRLVNLDPINPEFTPELVRINSHKVDSLINRSWNVFAKDRIGSWIEAVKELSENYAAALASHKHDIVFQLRCSKPRMRCNAKDVTGYFDLPEISGNVVLTTSRSETIEIMKANMRILDKIDAFLPSVNRQIPRRARQGGPAVSRGGGAAMPRGGGPAIPVLGLTEQDFPPLPH